MSMSNHAFISYAHADKYFAELLQVKLTEVGVPVWQDTLSLMAGEEWRQAIDDAISHCGVVILALSQASCNSHFVTYEWARGLGLNKPLIPVLLEDCNRHPKIEPIQYLDFRNHTEASWQLLVKRAQTALQDAEKLDNSQDQISDAEQAALNKKDKELIGQIEAYLMGNGFRMMSFDRVRDKVDDALTDDELKALIGKYHGFGVARLKGPKQGLKLL